MNHPLTNQKGIGIIAAVFVMLVMSVIGLTLASLLGENTFSSVNYLQSQQAFYLAETGIQAAMFQISKGGGAWTGWSGTNPKTIQLTLTGYGDYNVSVNTTTNVITSTGLLPSRSAANMAVRIVSATAAVVSSKWTITNWKEVY